jgi:hypothetical protein
MNATASVWDLDEDFDNVDDTLPVSGSIPARNSGIMTRKQRQTISPLERCLEECAQHGENVLIIEDTSNTNFFQVEDAGSIDFLELVVTGRDTAATTGKRARIQLLSRKNDDNR